MKLTESEWKYVRDRSEAFTGRSWLFERLASLLTGPAGVVVVCGPPGCGKTAFAAQVAMSSAGRIPGGPIPADTVDAALFCRAGQVNLLEVSRRLADQLAALPDFARERQAARAHAHISDVRVATGPVAPGAVVAGVYLERDDLGAERAFSADVAVPLARMADAGARPPVVLVDAVDEAFATPVAQELPRVLGELTGVRLVVTARDDARVLAQLGQAATTVHLLNDAPPDADDVHAYVQNRLSGTCAAGVARVLATRISAKAKGNFLYAVYVAGAVLESDALRDITRKAAARLPLPRGGLPGVYREFLRRELARDETAWSTQIRPILAPIAVSLGNGLTTSQLARIGSRLTDGPVSRSQARDVTRLAGQFLEGPRPDGPFRPYHQSFAEFLTSTTQNPEWTVDAEETHKAIAETLTANVPKGPTGQANWQAADAYTRDALAIHAAAGGRLDALLLDPGYLLAASPAPLLSVLGEARSTPARRAASAYRRIAHRIADRAAPSRPGYLRLAALQTSTAELAAAMNGMAIVGSWWPVWARWRLPTPSRVVGELTSRAAGLAVAETDAGPLAVACGGRGGGFGLECWEPRAGRRLSVWQASGVTSVAAAIVGGESFVVAGHSDGTVTLHNLPELNVVAREQAREETRVTSIVALAGNALAATGDIDGTLTLRRLPDLEIVGQRANAHTIVYALATVEHNGVPLLVSAGDTVMPDRRRDPSVTPARVWTVPELTLVAETGSEKGIVQYIGAAATPAGCLLFVSGAGRMDVELLEDPGGHLRALDSLPVFLKQCLPLGGADDPTVLICSDRLTPLSVSSADGEAELSAGTPVEAEYAYWAGPTTIHGRRVVLSASDSLRSWDVDEILALATQPRQAADQQRHQITGLAACGEVLAVLAADGVVQRWRWRDGTQLAPLPASATAIAGCVIDGRAHCIIASENGTVEAYDAATAERWPAVVHSGEIAALAAGSFGGRAIAATAGELEHVAIPSPPARDRSTACGSGTSTRAPRSTPENGTSSMIRIRSPGSWPPAPATASSTCSQRGSAGTSCRSRPATHGSWLCAI